MQHQPHTIEAGLWSTLIKHTEAIQMRERLFDLRASHSVCKHPQGRITPDNLEILTDEATQTREQPFDVKTRTISTLYVFHTKRKEPRNRQSKKRITRQHNLKSKPVVGLSLTKQTKLQLQVKLQQRKSGLEEQQRKSALNETSLLGKRQQRKTAARLRRLPQMII